MPSISVAQFVVLSNITDPPKVHCVSGVVGCIVRAAAKKLSTEIYFQAIKLIHVCSNRETILPSWDRGPSIMLKKAPLSPLYRVQKWLHASDITS